ncbi:MAG: copper chaperone PCu(A)C [Croceibacterium sp.]
MKSAIWPAAALALAAFGPAACGDQQPAGPAGPQAPAGVTVSNGRLALPAVKGNPGAVYFDLANAGPKAVMVRNANVEGAQSAMIHTMATWNGKPDMQELMQQSVKAGETLKFEPGKLHVMAMNLADTLKAGGTTNVTLHFATGDAVTFPAKVMAAGDAR